MKAAVYKKPGRKNHENHAWLTESHGSLISSEILAGCCMDDQVHAAGSRK